MSKKVIKDEVAIRQLVRHSIQDALYELLEGDYSPEIEIQDTYGVEVGPWYSEMVADELEKFAKYIREKGQS